MTSPELLYTINFTNVGTYTIWLRGYGPNAAGDSVSIGLNNQPIGTLTGFSPGQWSWAADSGGSSNGKVTLNVTTPGVHTLHVWQREDGLRLDNIVLTTDENYMPN